MEGCRERLRTWLWFGLVGALGMTMLCAVNFKSWRTSGSSGWSDGGTAWVVWGFLGSGAVLALLVVALVVDEGWFERIPDPEWIVGAVLAALLLGLQALSWWSGGPSRRRAGDGDAAPRRGHRRDPGAVSTAVG